MSGQDSRHSERSMAHANIRIPSLPVPSPSYIAHLMTALGDMYHAEHNPNGMIPLCVAENKLVVHDLLMEYMCHSNNTTTNMVQAGFAHADVYGYHDALGLPEVRQGVAAFLDQWLVHAENQYHQDSRTARTSASTSTQSSISPDHIMIGTGLSSVISMVLLALRNIHNESNPPTQQIPPPPQDAILIPAPYYAAFDRDVSLLANCRPIPVPCTDPIRGPTVHDLEAAVQQLAHDHEDWRVRFLLLTNPHNPLGVVYSPNVLQECLTWARGKSIHTLVDEVYALSVLDDATNNNPFQSVLQMLHNDNHNHQYQFDKEYIHVLWGLSKDFAASGFRIGILVTQHPSLLAALSDLNAMATVPHPMQRMVAALLHDTTFVRRFLATSRQRLRQQYQLCTNMLDSLDIPYVPAQAGMFVYLDLSSCLSPSMEEQSYTIAERQLADQLVEQARIVLTPGFDQHDPNPGWFRLCYAYVAEDVLIVALERLRAFVLEHRKEGSKSLIHTEKGM